MKSRSDIWLRALEELGAQCTVDTARDAQTFVSRLKREGDGFLTITLPAFGKDLEKALANEGISREHFTGWPRSRGKVVFHASDGGTSAKQLFPGIPQFLGGFLDLVFEDVLSVGVSSDQTEINDLVLSPSLRYFADEAEMSRAADAIAAVRQLCLMFGKEKERCSDAADQKAIDLYRKTDSELINPLNDERAAILFEGKRLERVKQVVRIMFGDALSFVDGEIYHERLIPGHGPGTTQDRLLGNQKWGFPTWHDRLEMLFPYGGYAIPNYRHSWKYAEVKFLPPGLEPPVKVSLVPKTQLTPRLIAIEPTCMQYIQQAISRCLVENLESYKSLSKWFLGFTDQTPNNFMALIGSEDGSLATLDLSEASDRVANWLVEELFSDWPWFSEGIDACRSTTAKLPSGEIIQLQKFASMGSAMTFPIEAMVFAAIVVERVLSSTGQKTTRRAIYALKDTVRVYGDDIICPVGSAESVIDGLETFGFKVNRNKSFWTGRFRESCGKEYWNGFDVSVVRFRTKLPASLRDAREIISTVSTRNQLYTAGLKMTAAMLDGVIGPILKGMYPIVAPNSPVIGRLDDSIPYEFHGFNPMTQAPFVRGYVVKSTSPVNRAEDLDALTKCLTSTIGVPNAGVDHLERSGRPWAVTLKLTKAQPF